MSYFIDLFFFYFSDLEYASEFRNEETATLRKDFEKFENNMKSLSQKLEEAQLSIKSLSEKLEDAQQNLSEKVSKVVGNASFFQEKVEKNLDEVILCFSRTVF